MAYTVLARKWRPRGFADMVGQEHVIRALSNALDSDRLHHAFLFAGTRGVGKTTVARVLAKSLNCDKGVSSKPCGECAACTEIDEGRFVDLIEVDAASRTKVDDTRELLDNVQYAPTRGRFKVYLIDEVHMLSRHSFNALLKTLEEPPPHVKFLLATTDPQRLPATVLSRCLQFNLRRLTVDLIEGRLRQICAAEKIEFEAAALEQLARAADGSLRDGLSLLDQAIAFAGGQLTAESVRDMLGTVDRHKIHEVLRALAAGDAAATLDTIAAMDEWAPDYATALDDIAGLMQRVALVQAVPETGRVLPEDKELIAELAEQMAVEDVQLYYQMAITGRRDLPLAPDARSGFEMTVLRMLSFRPATASGAEPGPAGHGQHKAAAPARKAKAKSAPPAQASAAPAAAPARPAADSAPAPAVTASDPQPAAPLAPPATASPPTAAPEMATSDWPALLASLDLQGAARQLAANCTLQQQQGRHLRLALDPSSEHLLAEATRERLLEALTAELGAGCRVTIEVLKPADETPAERDEREQAERFNRARLALGKEPLVRGLEKTFGAAIDEDSVRLIEPPSTRVH